MTALAIEAVVAQLTDAGLKISLAPAGGLAVTPASRLTEELRDRIRQSKSPLIDWLMAAIDVALHAPDLPGEPVDFQQMATAYNFHHFNCPTCSAAGRGTQYGPRCGVGTALWASYQDLEKSTYSGQST